MYMKFFKYYLYTNVLSTYLLILFTVPGYIKFANICWLTINVEYIPAPVPIKKTIEVTSSIKAAAMKLKHPMEEPTIIQGSSPIHRINWLPKIP